MTKKELEAEIIKEREVEGERAIKCNLASENMGKVFYTIKFPQFAKKPPIRFHAFRRKGLMFYDYNTMISHFSSLSF